jgi:hypothetical protein
MSFDIQNLTVTAGGTVSPTLQQFTIECKIVDTAPPHAVLFDFTGANAVTWPNVLSTLTAQQRADFIRQSLLWLLQTKTGLT